MSYITTPCKHVQLAKDPWLTTHQCMISENNPHLGTLREVRSNHSVHAHASLPLEDCTFLCDHHHQQVERETISANRIAAHEAGAWLD